MTDKPLVTVIIIFLNAQKFLEEAIASVLEQTYSNWELLLVDDGSTDGSTEIARRYAAKFPDKIRYLEHEGHQNRGMSASRNVGIAQARGRYVAFLDADDVWLPQKLEEQVAILDAHPDAAMVYGPGLFWYGWTGNPDDISRDHMQDVEIAPDTLIPPPKLFARFLRNPAISPAPSGILVRCDFLRTVGGFEGSMPGMYDDQGFYTKICTRAPVYVSGRCWYRYRRHPEAYCIASLSEGRHKEERKRYLEWATRYLTTHNLGDDEVWAALRRELFPYRHPLLFRLRRRIETALHRAKISVRVFVRRCLPDRLVYWLKARRPSCYNGARIRWGSLRRLKPISRKFGFDRGRALDRYYIENFLAQHASDVRGDVLEIGHNVYTRQFGGNRVTRSDVLNVVDIPPQTTIVADLTCADHIPSDRFDCIIFTQTLQCIYDAPAAIRTLYRILKPGGVLLATTHGTSYLCDFDWERWGEYWRFSSASARRLFAEVFGANNVEVRAHGNVLVASAFLHGLAVEELTTAELDYRDPSFEVLITVRAVKPMPAHRAPSPPMP